MLNHQRPILAITLLSVCFLFNSCLENPEITELESIDKEFMEANLIIEDYIKSIDTSTENGKKKKTKWKDSKKSITLFKYVDGKKGAPDELHFNTNRDDIDGFTLVNEETITASVKPGEFVFWHASGGIEELVGIEFVEEAQEELGDLPDDLDKKNMWYIWVPKDASEGDLKYDILYRLKAKYRDGADDEIIRLDPKVHVVKTEENEGED